MNRRDFLEIAAASAVGAPEGRADSTQGPRLAGASTDREYWVSVLRRLADPVLTNLANGTLKARMPVE